MTEILQNLDWSVLHWIQDTFTCGFFDFIMPKISMTGDLGAIWLITAFIMLFSKKYRKCGILLVAGLGLCFLIGNLCLKPLVARSRPCWLDPGVKLLIPNETDYSFPSGHTLSSFAAATILGIRNKKFAVPAFILAGLIAFSRLYLYVHFPSDVLSGIVIGILIGLTVCSAGKYRLPTFAFK